MNRTPSPHPSPPLGERVPEGRVRGILRGSWSQCAVVQLWRLFMNRFAPDRGCVQGTSRSARATQGMPEEFEALRYADVLRLVLRTQPRSSLRFMAPMRVRSWRLKLSVNLSVLPASCRQKKLGSADETSAARCRAARTWRRFMVPMRAQNEWRLSLSRSSESGRGLPRSKTQARATWFRASARSWTAPVLWRFGFRCKNGFMAPMRDCAPEGRPICA